MLGLNQCIWVSALGAVNTVLVSKKPVIIPWFTCRIPKSFLCTEKKMGLKCVISDLLVIHTRNTMLKRILRPDLCPPRRELKSWRWDSGVESLPNMYRAWIPTSNKAGDVCIGRYNEVYDDIGRELDSPRAMQLSSCKKPRESSLFSAGLAIDFFIYCLCIIHFS